MCLIITVSCYRLDGFLQLMWMKKECSKAQMLLVWLPLNQEPSSIYCSQRKLLSLSRKITQGEKNKTKKPTKNFFCCFAGYSFFSECFYSVYLQLCISFCLCWMSCLISVQGKKGKNGLLSVSLCVLCRDFTEDRGHSRN